MNGWPQVGDDVDDIMAQLSGDEDGNYPRGFAGLAVTSIATLVTTPITAALNAYMRIQRLCLGTAAIADLVRVTRIDVGSIALNVGSNPVPGVCFARDAVGTMLDASVWATPSVPPIVTVYNGTAGTVIVEGGLFGPVSLKAPPGVA
jgi:hypothetical protein